ncbi:MAG TPA: trehalase family glycosidase [Armatimonadota bacterium]|nr:trehalase family glycosidase [Armatimonadota bacterium]
MNQLKGSFIATGHILDACTACHDYPLSLLFSMCRAAIESNNRVFMYGDRLIRVNLNWVRDHVLTMKGFRYFESDITSFLDLMLETQTPTGFFYEIIAPLTDGHSGDYGPDYCCLRVPGTDFGLARLELEADIEYLMVEGVYMIWQATGDDTYLHRNLPHLEKGLRYLTSDPKRWDKHYQLVKRPRTIDTWDFLDRTSSSTDRSIHPDDPMGIMHGDNTGLYQAELLLATMYRQIDEEEKAKRWELEAAALKERINRYLWNGQFYKHFLPLDDTNYGVDEAWQLSLSNASDINRGTVTFDMARSIINTYRSMRTKFGGELDDFRNLEPPYPCFFNLKAGEYVNGAIAPFVAGQLALGAFEFGEERYGADILRRIGTKMSRDGKVAFLYNYNGGDIGGGPRCWCGAELMHAMAAGLAGVRDNGALFRDVTISPRFTAADEPRAHVRLEYAVSGAAIEYHFTHDQLEKQMTFTLLSEHDHAKLRMLLPEHANNARAVINGVDVPFDEDIVGESRYLVVDSLPQHAHVEISYK